jgi:hypothetical protein
LHESLDFVERTHRYDRIIQAHEETFDWIFEKRDLGLVSWLRSGSGIYWIQGKPGSGKSTLIKFLQDNQRTSEILYQWRQGCDQTSAWFYFNERGSHVEKSFEGLFRSIIRELTLKNERLAELVLEVYLERVKKSSKQKQTWHVKDLEYALTAILSQQLGDLEILLFLDALDEYSGPLELIAEFIQSLVQPVPDGKTKVKVLFSSRPWDTFVASFAECPGFKIHEQTKGDMRMYVLDRLRTLHHSRLSLTPPEEPAESEPRDIASTIVARAEGVFLWVWLVVESLLGAGPDVTTHQLEQILNALPDGLEELYERTAKRIPHSSRLGAFVVLEIVNRALQPLSVQDVVLAASCAEGRTLQECSGMIKTRLSGMVLAQEATQLKNLCGGLIDVGHSGSSLVVQFMHKTVKDFVSKLGFERRMLDRSHPPLYGNGFSFFMKYRLASLDVRSSSQASQLPGDSQNLEQEIGLFSFPELIHLASSAETTTGNAEEVFFDSIGDERIQSLFLNFSPRDYKPESVLSFAVFANLLLYTKRKLGISRIAKSSPQSSLLHVVVDALVQTRGSRAQMTRLLLEHNADIDRKFGGETPFQRLFALIENEKESWDFPPWALFAKFVEALLMRGQDANIDIPVVPRGEHLSSRNGLCKALHIARSEVSKTLLKHDAHVNTLDSQGFTALDRVFQDIETRGSVSDIEGLTASILLDHGGCVSHFTQSAITHLVERLGDELPDPIRKPPQLQKTLAQSVRSIVPSYLTGK